MRVAALAPSTMTALDRVTAIESRTDDPSQISDADVLVLAPRYGAALRERLPHMPSLRWVHALGAGVETLPFDLLRERSIVLTNSRGIYGDALAEFVIGAIHWFAKDFARLRANQAARRWEPFAVERVSGATLGIIGFGDIGRTVARRAEALGMTVFPASRKSGGMAAALQTDYVVLSVPLTSGTRGMIGEQQIASMKPNAVLINIARGAVVNETALVEALRARRIRGAALDVFETEPLPPDHPLWALDNVLLSPHSADRTADSHDRAVALFVENLDRFRRGDELANLVDLTAGY